MMPRSEIVGIAFIAHPTLFDDALHLVAVGTALAGVTPRWLGSEHIPSSAGWGQSTSSQVGATQVGARAHF